MVLEELKVGGLKVKTEGLKLKGSFNLVSTALYACNRNPENAQLLTFYFQPSILNLQPE